MTDRLQEIRARLDAATPGRGPWRADADFQSENPTLRVITGTYPDTVRMVAATLDAAETKFIAHAPADIAWLLAEIDALRERVAVLRAEVTDLEDIVRGRGGAGA